MGLIALKPQDVVILLKIVALGNKEWMNNQLAYELGISPAEISCSLERCKIAKLIDNTKKKVNILSFQDFMIHGLKYVYPPLPGAIVRGMPTAFSAEPIKSKISQGQDSYVWPSKDGNHSTLKKLPDGRLAQRLSPRRKKSYWTKLNMDRCIDLEDRGLMTPAGRWAFEHAYGYGYQVFHPTPEQRKK